MSGGQNLAMRRLAIAIALTGCAIDPAARSTRTPIHEDRLSGSWSQGICLVSGNIVRYTTKPDPKGLLHHGQLVLDVTVLSFESVICSEDFTVMLSPDRVTVTLGAQDVLDGTKMLGFVGNSLVFANSYQVLLSPVNADGGVKKARLDGKTLTLHSNNGHAWQLDLSDPYRRWQME